MQQAITADTTPAPNGVRRRRPAPPPESVTVKAHGDSGSFIVRYVWNGDRYSFWLHPGQQPATPSWISKRPGLESAIGARARDVQPGSKRHAPIVAQVMAIIERDRLVDAAEAAVIERKARDAADERAMRIDYAKSESGPELYTALKNLLRCAAIPDAWAEPARAALKACDDKIAAELAQMEAA